jgi:hypothetical protein
MQQHNKNTSVQKSAQKSQIFALAKQLSLDEENPFGQVIK